MQSNCQYKNGKLKKLFNSIFSVKNDNNHKVWTILGFKIKYIDKVRYYTKHQEQLTMFTKRNIQKNALIQIDSLHKLKPGNYPNYFREEIKAWFLLKEKFEYFILGHVNIPQIEFTLTTKCSLNCKDYMSLRMVNMYL